MLLFNPTSNLLPVVRGGAGEADHHLPHLLQVLSYGVCQSAQPLLGLFGGRCFRLKYFNSFDCNGLTVSNIFFFTFCALCKVVQ
jgi:hypothetical protein